MPVPDYTDQHPACPLTFEVFPAAAGGEARFSLYEDEGTDQGYLRDEYVRTPVSCRTESEGYVIEVGRREGGSFRAPGPRNFFFSVYVDKEQAPRQVWLDGRKLKKVKEAKLDAGADTDFQTAVWCVTDDGCRLRLPDDGQPHVLELR